MSDLISRQAAIEALCSECQGRYIQCDSYPCSEVEVINALPSAQPEPDEWCTDCKEYDKDKHCCPRWNRVIRQALKDTQPERKTGKWIKNSNGTYSCDKCHSWIPNEQHYYANFCLHCGAVMIGEEL